MTEKNIQLSDVEQIGDASNLEYIAEGIAIHTEIKDLNLMSGSVHPGVLVIIACINGKMQLDINASSIVVNANEIVVCHPNVVLGNFMFSSDYEGMALSLSPQIVMECLSESEIWDRFSHLSQSPVIGIMEDSMSIINLCGKIIGIKKTMEKSVFYKEIIFSVIKVALLESLANLDDFTPSHGSGLILQKDVLFKKFIDLLTGRKVKPRYVSWYANQLCVTPKYLSTVCKKISGKTAFEWINEYVLIDIRQLLKNSNKSIKEISEYLEFKSMSFFGKYCRQHFGFSPTDYRKHLREMPSNNE